jgi:hypothetical protein
MVATVNVDTLDQKLYVNGKEEATYDNCDGPFQDDVSNFEWYVGGESGFSNYLNGITDNVRFYNRALSAEEVKQLYRLGQ